MALLILLALVAIPLVEIAVFIQVGGEIGLGLTIVTTLLTAVIGTFLLRIQGLSTLSRLQDTLNQGEMPVRAAFDGACQLIAGIFLLIPGFVTDFVGLLLFLPPIRTLLLGALIRRANISVVVSGSRSGKGSGTGPGDPRARRDYDVEGEYQEVKPPPDPQPRPQINQFKPTDKS